VNLLETTIPLNDAEAGSIAGLAVIRDYTKKLAEDAQNLYVGKVWDAAKTGAVLTSDAVVHMSVSEDGKTLSYFAEDNSESGDILVRGYELQTKVQKRG
jgi:hypothetical protein